MAKRRKRRKTAAKKAPAPAAKRTKRTRRRTTARSAQGTRTVPMAGKSAAVQSLEAYRAELVAQRSQIDDELKGVDHALATMGRAVARMPVAANRPATPTGRSVRAGSLKDHIASVLAGGQVMAVRDITDGVVKSGYKSKNKTLAKSVGIALTEMPGVTKVGRGQFRMG